MTESIARVWDDFLTSSKHVKVHRTVGISEENHANREHRAHMERIQDMALRVDLARWGILVPETTRLNARWRFHDNEPDADGNPCGYWTYEVWVEVLISYEMILDLDAGRWGSTFLSPVSVPSSGNWIGIPTDPDMSIYSDEFEALLLKSKEHRHA